MRLHSTGWLDSTNLLLSGDDVDEPGKSVLLLASWDGTPGGGLHLQEQFGREPGVAESSHGPAMHLAIVPEWHFAFNSDARLETAFVYALGGLLCRVTRLLSTAVQYPACLLHAYDEILCQAFTHHMHSCVLFQLCDFSQISMSAWATTLICLQTLHLGAQQTSRSRTRLM